MDCCVLLRLCCTRVDMLKNKGARVALCGRWVCWHGNRRRRVLLCLPSARGLWPASWLGRARFSVLFEWCEVGCAGVGVVRHRAFCRAAWWWCSCYFVDGMLFARARCRATLGAAPVECRRLCRTVWVRQLCGGWGRGSAADAWPLLRGRDSGRQKWGGEAVGRGLCGNSYICNFVLKEDRHGQAFVAQLRTGRSIPP